MTAHSSCNKGYKYLLTIIDIFSKYAWAVPIKSKSGKDVAAAMKSVLIQSRIPTHLHIERGKEFYNSEFKALVKHHNTRKSSPKRNIPTATLWRKGAAYDEEDDEDELTDSDADSLIIDPERCIDDSVGDDAREFQHNLAGEHHLESSSSSSDVEDEEEEEAEGEEAEVKEDEEEGEAEVEGVWNGGDGDETRIGFGLLLYEIDQIRQMLGDIDRADDDGYYSDEDWKKKMSSHSSDDDDEWSIVDWGEDEEAEEEIIIGFSEATHVENSDDDNDVSEQDNDNDFMDYFEE
ncbi:uncharacterized protein [Neodiprion pinetum]|uniref:uncharacterized protein n=1 Tax=Neodiprion pinetum TaxID=441929 RepID=UPI0037109E8F